jgi:tRNA (guanine37-N1)-methyltransferase
VLLSGDHGRIAAWRHAASVRRTAERRPDLLHPSQRVGLDGFADTEVRPVQRADLGEVLTLQWACFPPALHEPLEVLAHDLLGATGFVVRAAGRLVACVCAAPDEDATVWHLSLLMVAPDVRGRGLGRWLLRYAEQAAPDTVATYRLFTGADDDANLRLYKRAGYSVRGHRPGHPDVVVLTRRRR